MKNEKPKVGYGENIYDGSIMDVHLARPISELDEVKNEEVDLSRYCSPDVSKQLRTLVIYPEKAEEYDIRMVQCSNQPIEEIFLPERIRLIITVNTNIREMTIPYYDVAVVHCDRFTRIKNLEEVLERDPDVIIQMF